MTNIKILVFSFLISSQVFAQGLGFNMSKLANIKLPGEDYNDIWGYTTADGKEFAIVGTLSHTLIYDVTNCGIPILVKQHTDSDSTIWRDYKTHRNAAYGVGDQGGQTGYTQGLQIFNLNTYAVSFDNIHFQRAHNIFVDTLNARLYVAGSNTVSRGLIIYDVSNPLYPVHLKNVRLDSIIGNPYPNTYCHDVYVKNNIAYTSNGNMSAFHKWDMTDLNNVKLLGSNGNSGGYNHSSWTTEDEAYIYEALEVGRGIPIKVYRPIGNTIAQDTFFKESLEMPISDLSRPHNPFVHQNKLYISYYEDGVQIFDLANPRIPKRIAYYDTYPNNNGSGYPSGFAGCWGVFPFLPSGCIVASDVNTGFFTLKMELPTSDGANLGIHTLQKGGNAIFSSVNSSMVLRSEKGYCYKLSIDGSNQITTTRVVCHTFNESSVRLEKSDLAFNNSNFGIVIQPTAGNCQQIKVSNGGVLNVQSIGCTSNTGDITFENGNLYLDTYTKGLVLKSNSGTCYRITVDDLGVLSSTALTTCPE